MSIRFPDELWQIIQFHAKTHFIDHALMEVDYTHPLGPLGKISMDQFHACRNGTLFIGIKMPLNYYTEYEGISRRIIPTKNNIVHKILNDMLYLKFRAPFRVKNRRINILFWLRDDVPKSPIKIQCCFEI